MNLLFDNVIISVLWGVFFYRWVFINVFNKWSSVLLLRFWEVVSGDVDIIIDFKCYDYGDGSLFDGRSKFCNLCLWVLEFVYIILLYKLGYIIINYCMCYKYLL